MTDAASSASPPHVSRREERLGFLLVFLSALFWSFGGAIARFIETPDSWAVVFWRSFWAAAFLVGFMLVRDGGRGTLKLFRDMGVPGIAVALCFATASSSFVVALAYTTVANILLMQAGVPLFAALLAFLLFRERVAPATWVAIAAVICGVAIMVSESFDGSVSPIGDGLALLIAVAFSIATVITRRFAHVRMTPANCLGTMIAAVFAATQVGTFAGLRFGHGMALRVRRAQSGAWPCLLRHRRAADPGCLRGPSRHVRDPARPGLGLAGARRDTVGAHDHRRRRHLRRPARPHRAGVQAHVSAATSRHDGNAVAQLTVF